MLHKSKFSNKLHTASKYFSQKTLYICRPIFLKMEKAIKKKNPLDEVLEDLENYDENISSHDLMSSGE